MACHRGWFRGHHEFITAGARVYLLFAVCAGLGIMAPPLTLSSIPTFSMSSASTVVLINAIAGTTAPAPLYPPIQYPMLPGKFMKRILDQE
jgi:hypothetical protein